MLGLVNLAAGMFWKTETDVDEAAYEITLFQRDPMTCAT
jgi:hypothetical protein